MPRKKKIEHTVGAGDPDDIINEIVVAQMLGCSVRRAGDLMREGKMPGRNEGSAGYVTTRRAVIEYLEATERC